MQVCDALDAVAVTRPRKSARRDAQPKAADNTEVKARRLYFDILADEANESIVRYTSAKPNSKYWARFIDEKDVATMYQVYGEYGRVISARFDYLSDCRIFMW